MSAALVLLLIICWTLMHISLCLKLSSISITTRVGLAFALFFWLHYRQSLISQPYRSPSRPIQQPTTLLRPSLPKNRLQNGAINERLLVNSVVCPKVTARIERRLPRFNLKTLKTARSGLRASVLKQGRRRSQLLSFWGQIAFTWRSNRWSLRLDRTASLFGVSEPLHGNFSLTVSVKLVQRRDLLLNTILGFLVVSR